MMNIEKAAQKLADCMDYPWELMPEQGRENMRNHVRAILEAANQVPAEDVRAVDEPVAIVCGSQVQWLPAAGKIPDRSPLFIHAKRETVMPERMNPSNDSVILGGIGLYGHASVFAAATIWNHCLDEFKRLNP